jgi:hypothetical protein
MTFLAKGMGISLVDWTLYISFRKFGICVYLISNWLGCSTPEQLVINKLDISRSAEIIAQELYSAKCNFLLLASFFVAGGFVAGGMYNWCGSFRDKNPVSTNKNDLEAALLNELRYGASFPGIVRRSIQRFFAVPIIMFLSFFVNNVCPSSVYALWPTPEKLLVEKMQNFFAVATRLKTLSQFYGQMLNLDLIELRIFLGVFREALLDLMGVFLFILRKESGFKSKGMSLSSHVAEKISVCFNDLVSREANDITQLFRLCGELSVVTEGLVL